MNAASNTASNTASNAVPTNLLERVRKLLAQAEDPSVTEAEAEAFNAKAAELIARHGIEAALLAHSGARRDDITQRAITVHNPYRRDKGYLLTCVAGPMRCRTIHYRNSVDVFGYASDTERVELLFTSLLIQATTQLIHLRPDNSYGYESTTAYRRSWFNGFSNAVYARLVRAEQAAATTNTAPSGTSTALVLADRKGQVETAFTRAYPRIRTMPTRRLSGSGRSDGYAAGTRADLGSDRLTNRRTAIGR
jgi:hypothetical protein